MLPNEGSALVELKMDMEEGVTESIKFSLSLRGANTAHLRGAGLIRI